MNYWFFIWWILKLTHKRARISQGCEQAALENSARGGASEKNKRRKKSACHNLANYRKVSIWWDLEKYQIPAEINPQMVTCNIILALSDLGYHGEVSMYLYGDGTKILPKMLKALNGMIFIHVPPGKDVVNLMAEDMLFWGHENQDPASYLLVSGDLDLWHALKKLWDKNYQIMLACLDVHLDYDSRFTAIWDINSLLSGGHPFKNTLMY